MHPTEVFDCISKMKEDFFGLWKDETDGYLIPTDFRGSWTSINIHITSVLFGYLYSFFYQRLLVFLS